VVVEAGGDRLPSILVAAIAGQRHEHRALESRIAPHAARDLVAVDARQPDVDEHHVGKHRTRGLQRGDAVVHHVDAMPERL
jgi:hypothetical protein